MRHFIVLSDLSAEPQYIAVSAIVRVSNAVSSMTFGPGAKTLIELANGHTIAVRETIEQIEALIQGAD